MPFRLRQHLLLSCIALETLVLSVPTFAAPPHPAFPLMVEAATRERAAQQVLHAHKLALGLLSDTLDPLRTGLIGVEFSPITTTPGSLKAKRTAANPDFAAYIVRELVDHGIGSGDSVLVAMTGSFPGLNLAVLTALETLHASSLRICSLGASSYGANEPAFTWLDMEDLLCRERVLARRSDCVTLGGTGDVGGGLTDEGKLLLRRKAEDLGYPVLETTSLRKQAALRREIVGSPRTYALLINIGGNQAMLGRGPEGRELPGGWNEPPDAGARPDSSGESDGIIFDFLEARVPVFNLLHIEDIATAAGLPFDPSAFSEPGTSPVYFLAQPHPGE